MKRSEINRAITKASNFFKKNGWFLPPNPKWDITDFGLGTFRDSGLVLVNLTEEPEYCEKIMYLIENQVVPAHYHKKKKEDIICRSGNLVIQLWKKDPAGGNSATNFEVKINGEFSTIVPGAPLFLGAGERVTIEPGIWHSFYAASEECMIGEVSTANDDSSDNYFSNSKISRFPNIIEDEPSIMPLISERI